MLTFIVAKYTIILQVYCDMELSCGGRDGGWMRIANIQNGGSCPNGWKQILSPAKACRANSDAAGCYSAFFSSNKLSYQHICGKVVGYQKAPQMDTEHLFIPLTHLKL